MSIQSLKSNNIYFSSRYKQDDDYRKNLANGLKSEYGINVSPDSLKSVLGAQELAYLLKNELKPENFSIGENFQNINDGRFRVNLHMHTNYSDGKMSPKKLLDQTKKYAEYRAALGKIDPVIVGITDHDTVNGAREAVKIISQHPEDYENIRLVTGVEFNAYYPSENRKIQLEAIGYSINPFKTVLPVDEDVAKFLEKGRTKNDQYLQELVKGTGTTLGEIKKQSKFIKDLGSPAFMRSVKTALEKISSRSNVDLIMQKHDTQYGNIYINPGTPSVQEIAGIVNKSGNGFVGIAHPGRSFKPERGFNKADIDNLFKSFKNFGIKAAEYNYQYYPKDKDGNNLYGDIQSKIERNDMLKTGGLDCHRDNIFSGRRKNSDLTKLPADIQDILES